MSLKKVQVNLDESLISLIDDFALKMHVNRTSAISFLISQSLEQKQALETLDNLLEYVKSQSDSDLS